MRFLFEVTGASEAARAALAKYRIVLRQRTLRTHGRRGPFCDQTTTVRGTGGQKVYENAIGWRRADVKLKRGRAPDGTLLYFTMRS